MLRTNPSGNVPYTPSLPLLYGLRKSLSLLAEEGMPNVVARHHRWGHAGRLGGWAAWPCFAAWQHVWRLRLPPSPCCAVLALTLVLVLPSGVRTRGRTWVALVLADYAGAELAACAEELTLLPPDCCLLTLRHLPQAGGGDARGGGGLGAADALPRPALEERLADCHRGAGGGGLPGGGEQRLCQVGAGRTALLSSFPFPVGPSFYTYGNLYPRGRPAGASHRCTLLCCALPLGSLLLPRAAAPDACSRALQQLGLAGGASSCAKGFRQTESTNWVRHAAARGGSTHALTVPYPALPPLAAGTTCRWALGWTG